MPLGTLRIIRSMCDVTVPDEREFAHYIHQTRQRFFAKNEPMANLNGHDLVELAEPGSTQHILSMDEGRAVEILNQKLVNLVEERESVVYVTESREFSRSFVKITHEKEETK